MVDGVHSDHGSGHELSLHDPTIVKNVKRKRAADV